MPIEIIKIGDKVWAYNEHNQTKELQEVTHLIRGEGDKELTEITLDSGEVIKATSNHPFYNVLSKEWTDAGKLNLDTILLNIYENNTSIRSLRSYSQEATVYNLTVANDHTYFVGRDGVLGHNMNENCPFPMPNAKMFDHLFWGKSERNKLAGLHHQAFGYAPKGYIITRLNQVPSRAGFYKAIVSRRGSKATKYSTMFPDSWSRRRVKKVINKAYYQMAKDEFKNNHVSLESILGSKYQGINIIFSKRKGGKDWFSPEIVD